MPPRSFTLAVIAFWLAMVGLFVYDDVWPRLAPAEPSLFPVDVVDEAGHQRDDTDFEVAKNGGAADYRLELAWRYHPEDDSFESEGKLERRFTDDPEAPRPQGPAWLPQIHSVEMRSSYQLTRAGEMKGITATTKYELAQPVNGQEASLTVEAQLTGAPRAGRFAPHLQLSFPEPNEEGAKEGANLGLPVRPVDRDAAAVSVSARGTVLNPLHPPRRFDELRPGQRWRVAVVDPFALLALVNPLDAARGGALREAGVAGDAGAFDLDVRVLPDLEPVELRDGTHLPCRVVRCTGDGPVGPLTYWIRPRDGSVMREEVSVAGDSWTLRRLPPGYKMRSPPKTRKVP